MKNIVLTGLSGSGKSTLGRMLAKELGLPFVDLDEQIVEMAGMSVAKIFSGYGEHFFREIEAHAVGLASLEGGKVIATGGGAILREENLVALRSNGFVIFIDRPVELIERDIELAGRPLLAGGVTKLRDMAAARRGRYLAGADLVFRNDGDEWQALAALLAACAPLACRGYAVIGSPIGHSLSPVIHGAAFAAQGISDDYSALHVPRGALAEFVAGVRASEMRGFNVTIPHKQGIIPLLDEVEDDARVCGAVNTVARCGERLVGYNTDMGGFALSLKRVGHGLAGRRVLLLGAGGAARAVALKAARDGAAELCILGRTREKAEELAVLAAAQSKVPARGGAMTRESLAEEAARCDLLVNATPLGMSGMEEDFTDLTFLERMPPGGLVCDLVYNPPRTSLLRRAEELGLDALNGMGMLIYQALLAQERFLDRELDKERLYGAVEAALAEQGKGISK